MLYTKITFLLFSYIITGFLFIVIEDIIQIIKNFINDVEINKAEDFELKSFLGKKFYNRIHKKFRKEFRNLEFKRTDFYISLVGYLGLFLLLALFWPIPLSIGIIYLGLLLLRKLKRIEKKLNDYKSNQQG